MTLIGYTVTQESFISLDHVILSVRFCQQKSTFLEIGEFLGIDSSTSGLVDELMNSDRIRSEPSMAGV